MNAPIHTAGESAKRSAPIELGSLLSTWVDFGLSLFIRHSDVSGPACQRLVESQPALSDEADSDAWPGFCAWIQSELQRDRSPLHRLCDHFELDLADLFLLALLGEIEQNHRVALALAELQNPVESARPSVHLFAALCDQLFSGHRLTPQQLSDHPLLEAGIVQLCGDGPLVLQELELDLRFWRVLFAAKLSWPGVSAVEQDRQQLLGSEPLASLQPPNSLTHYLLKGELEQNRLYIGQLVHSWRRQPLEVPLPVWQQFPALRLACQLTDCVPLLDLSEAETSLLPQSHYRSAVFLLGSSDSRISASNLVEMNRPRLTAGQRHAIWQQQLEIDRELAEPFRHVQINGPQIRRLIKQARHLAADSRLDPAQLRQAWSMISAERLASLADNVNRQVPREALVLPEKIYAQLDDLSLRARRREPLWEGLGISARSATNFGVRGLFVGDSGTGKTLAASYLATELGMPLYRVDISAIMDKYVGESEKNLNRLFNQAARYDVMLLLDEADSLFGRRGDQEDPGARFGNMLTNFLLSRIESYSGIVLLTSNSRARIDPAFMRRLDAVIEFPKPEFEQRLGIWRSHLGERSPGDEVCRRLASYCELPGGGIRNAVLFAAARRYDIQPLDLLDGLAAEYRKLGRSLPAELQQWWRTEREVSDASPRPE